MSDPDLDPDRASLRAARAGGERPAGSERTAPPEESRSGSAKPPARESAPLVFLGDRLEEVARLRGDAVALVDGPRRTTYRELLARADALAQELVSRGIGPGNLVGVALPRSDDLVIAVAGVVRAGAAYVPVDLSHPAERRSLILSDAQPRVLVTNGAPIDGVPSGTEVLPLPRHARPWPSPRPRPSAEDPAYVIYTSGSTGQPNGVSISQRNAARLFTAAEPLFGFSADDVWTLFHSIAFDFSVWEMWGALLHGSRLVIVPAEATRAADVFHALLLRERVTVLNQTPSAFRAFDAADVAAGRPANTLRYVVFGGEALDPRTLKGWIDAHGDEQPRLVNMYGITETTVHVTFRRMRARDARGSGRSVIGSALPDLRIELLAPDGRPVAEGEVGEIWVGGEGVSAGYIGRPGLTAERFRADPRGKPPGALRYRSGDLGRFLPDGDLEYLGRADLQVKLRGFRIELGEIEAAMRADPDVRDAVVTLRGDPATGPRLVAYVVLDRQTALDPEAQRARLTLRLPEYMVPAAFVRIDRVPRTVNDKVDRSSLPEPTAADFPQASGGDDPRDEMERDVAQIFSDVLGTEVRSRESDFFRLGGHSLLAVRVAVLCHQRLGVELSANAIFGHPTVARFAEAVHQEKQSGRTARPASSIPADGSAPLSHAQVALWLDAKLRSDSDAYNEPVALRIAGHLDADRLRRAAVRLAGAHEVLRARLIETEAEPRLVCDRDPEAIEFRFAGSLGPGAETGTPDLAGAIARPFDLREGPLWRVELLHAADETSVLLLVVHHLILDAASQGILLRDLAAAYADPDRPIDAPAQRFTDLAIRERERTDSGREELGRYWATALAGAELSPALPPPCVPCPLGEADRGCVSRRALAPALVQNIRALAAAWGTTPFHLYFAAYLALLRSYTAGDDLVVGSPVSLRDAPAAEGVVGYLLSPTALRVPLAGERSFRELVHDVAHRWREVRWNARLPLHLVLQAAQGPHRTSVGSPIQIFFSLVHDTIEGLQWNGSAVARIPLAPSHVKFKAFLLVEEREEDASLVLEHRRGVLDPDMAERLLGHLEVVLRAAMDRPETALAKLPTMGADELASLRGWGNPTAPYPRDRSLAELFEDVARARGGSTALVSGGLRLTYAELDRRANAVAAALRVAGIGAGDRVPLLIGRGIRFVVCALGVLKCGAAYVPLDPSYPPERLRRMLEGLGVRAGILGPGLRPADGSIAWLDADAAHPETPSAPATPRVGPEDPAYVMFTSGSTGRPKGVEVPHRAIVRLVFGQDFVRMGPDETWLQMAPTSFDASTLEIWAPLLHGGRCVVIEDAVPTPVLLEETIRRESVTSAWITASLFNALVDEAPECLSGLRQILVGGEALSPPHVRRALDHLPGSRLVNGYGPTENTTFTCCHVIRREDVEPGRSVPIGVPIANTSVHVLDPDGRLAPVGIPGELVAGGDGVALGYVGQPDRSAESFQPDTFSGRPGARLYRTGDRVRWRPEGVLEFLARFDDQVKVRGHRVEPGEVAICLAEHEEVRRAVVIPRPSASGAVQLVAYVVPRERKPSPDLARLLTRHAAERLPPYMVPASFVFLPDFPLKPNGKIDVAELRKATHDSSSDRWSALLSPVEARILPIWRDVLKDAELGPDADFFESGGDSLLAVRMLSRLEREFGKGVPARVLTEAGTVRRLAASLAGPARTRSAYPAGVVEMRAGDSDRPIFCLPGMGSVAFQFHVLAKRLRTGRQLLAIEVHDMDIAPSVLESLPETAEAVVRRMRQVQPDGPYAFVGYSYGGNLAVEVARRLMNENQAVELVTVLDAYAPGSIRNPVHLRKVARHFRILMRLKRHEAYRYISSRILRRFGLRSDVFPDEGPTLPTPTSELERRLADTSERCSRAFDVYRPGPFPGRIVLVHATDLGDWMEVADPSGTCGWGAICTEGVDIIPIGCRHLDIFQEPHLTELAEHLDALFDSLDEV